VNTYVLDTGVNCTAAGTYFIYVVNTNNQTSPNVSESMDNAYFGLNTFNVAVTPNATDFGVLSGDNATVTIITAGPLPGTTRVGANFTVSSTEANASAVKTATNATAGTITYKITAGTTAGLYNVTVSNGDARNATKIRSKNI